ncbi:MAG: hypothetical protein Kow0022_06580 [Phycisphaerales bacterium]
MMRTNAFWALPTVLAIASADGPPIGRELSCEIAPIEPRAVLADVVADLRPQDARVTSRLIEEAAALGSDTARARVLIAVAQNPTITPEAELRLMDELHKLNSREQRANLLVAIASTLRVCPLGPVADEPETTQASASR